MNKELIKEFEEILKKYKALEDDNEDDVLYIYDEPIYKILGKAVLTSLGVGFILG